MKRLLTTASLMLAAFSAFAYTATYTPPLKEVPGVMEFSGQVVARPLQVSTLLELGYSQAAADFIRKVAAADIANDVKEYVPETDEYILTVPQGMADREFVLMLRAKGNYDYVTPDWRVFPTVIPNDTQWANLWGHVKAQTPQAWDLFTGANTIIVANCDTGVRLDHEEFVGQLVPGFNAVNDLPQASGGQVNDLHGHGTHTMGTMAALGNNAKGITGIGWNFKGMPVRVSNLASGSANMSDLTQGARWAADNGARAVNVSYSGVSDPTVQTTGNYLKVTKNSLLCWAAGNNNTNQSGFDWADVIIVGATDSADARASFSNYGTSVDCVAPGVNILSTYLSSTSSYAWMDGTSMATPFVTGLCALLMASNPGGLTAAAVEANLYAGCQDLGAAGDDSVFGKGRVNAYKSLRNAYNWYFIPASSASPLQGVKTVGWGYSIKYSDNNYMSFSPVADGMGNALPIIVETTAYTTAKVVAAMSCTWEVKASGAGFTLDTYMWNYSTGAYVLVDTRAAPTADTQITVSQATGANFVNPTSRGMKTKFVLRPNVTTTDLSWTFTMDQIKWQTKVP